MEPSFLVRAPAQRIGVMGHRHPPCSQGHETGQLDSRLHPSFLHSMKPSHLYNMILFLTEEVEVTAEVLYADRPMDRRLVRKIPTERRESGVHPTLVRWGNRRQPHSPMGYLGPGQYAAGNSRETRSLRKATLVGRRRTFLHRLPAHSHKGRRRHV